MTPIEKASKLTSYYLPFCNDNITDAKYCALIAVDEILSEYSKIIPRFLSVKKEFPQLKYWKEVKQEIEKL